MIEDLKSILEESIKVSETLYYRIKEIKKSLIMEFIFPGKEPDIKKEFAEDFSSSCWERVKLIDLIEPEGLIHGIKNDLINSNYNNKGYPVILPEHIKSLRFFPDNLKYIPENQFPDAQMFLVMGGDIILNQEDGSSALVPFMHSTGIAGPNIIRIRVNSSIAEIFYVLNIMHFYYNSGIMKVLPGKGRDLSLITVEKILNLTVPLPPLEKQREIADMMLKLSGAMVIQENYINETKKFLNY